MPVAMLEETGYLLVLAEGLEADKRSEEDAEELWYNWNAGSLSN